MTHGILENLTLQVQKLTTNVKCSLGWVVWANHMRAPPKINSFGIRIHPVKYQVEIQRSHPSEIALKLGSSIT